MYNILSVISKYSENNQVQPYMHNIKNIMNISKHNFPNSVL